IYQASEIYGGINGFWDYGPLGAQLKKNLRDAWWQDMIMNPCWGRKGPNGEKVRCVPVETRIIQHPKVWAASGHIGGFNDPMVDCRETKARYRYDHVSVFVPQSGDPGDKPLFAYVGDTPSEAKQRKKAEKTFGSVRSVSLTTIPVANFARVLGPDAEKVGTLTEPRQFNLMFKTYIGATATEDDVAYLRPETAQGIFVQFKNVVDTTRVRVPFGIGNTGTSFRNEVTPRNFTFRSREFDQAELEFFCHPDESQEWYRFWRDFRMEWWKSIGLAGDNLILREHEKDELSHYSQGTSDVEYRFPFTAPGFGELEGIAHRGSFDLTQHQEHSKVKLDYFDTDRGELLPNGSKKGERYIPHCIEPAAGLDRGVLAILCESYTKDPSRPSPEIMKFHPRLAPIKAAVFPLVNKDGMPEIAEKLHEELSKKFGHAGFIETDAKQSIGKRYARMDEAGCPFCFTIDGDTTKDQTVTVRDRDTGTQERISLDKVSTFLGDKLGS
ncbi:MAG TPA: glycine--tRNA ligase, partial [Phycisphaerales bacterium]|nr:glycine--tRNA ligase [Phycisphaerales bacterium]